MASHQPGDNVKRQRIYSAAAVVADELRRLADDVEKDGGEASFDIKIFWRAGTSKLRSVEQTGSLPVEAPPLREAPSDPPIIDLMEAPRASLAASGRDGEVAPNAQFSAGAAVRATRR